MTNDAWLSEPEQRAWRGFIGLQNEVRTQVSRRLQQETGLSGADYDVLVILSEAPSGRLRAFEISAVIKWEKSRLSHQISRMEKEGLVRREPCETDGRGFFAVLTDQGWEKLLAAVPSHVADVREAFITPLSRDELVALGDMLKVIAKGLEPGRN